MAEASSNQQNRPGNWEVVQLRLTGFPVDPIEVPRGGGWWLELMGEEPERHTYKKTMELQEVGQFANGQLVVEVNPLHFDWRFVLSEVEVLDEIPTLGSFTANLTAFVPLMQRWLKEKSPPLQRLAFGADLILPVLNKREGYLSLASFLPVEIDLDNSNDFFYQINRKKPLAGGIENLHVNRLSKWMLIRFNVGVQQNQIAFEIPGLEKYAVRLELDINTVAEFRGNLGRDSLPALFDELVRLGCDIAEKGDRS